MKNWMWITLIVVVVLIIGYLVQKSMKKNSEVSSGPVQTNELPDIEQVSEAEEPAQVQKNQIIFS